MLSTEENDCFVINSLVSVFPNPSNGNAEIELKADCDVNVKVYNQIGMLLYNNDITKEMVSDLNAFLSDLNVGMYFIDVIGNNRKQIVKFVKY